MDAYPEEEVPYTVSWAGEDQTYLPNWGIYPEAIKMRMPFDKHFRPRFAMALAMHARDMGGDYDWQNAPFWHPGFGWTAFQGIALGKETDWADPPGRTESLCAWLIWYTIQIQTIHGASPENAVLNYLAQSEMRPYVDQPKVDDELRLRAEAWSNRSWKEHDVILPFNRQSFAIVALCYTTPQIRRRYGFRLLGTSVEFSGRQNLIPWADL